MNIFVDIDETICTYEGERDYANSIPLPHRIARINALYDQGHHIVYWTARGGTTGLDWTEHTRQQLDAWGVKRHELRMGKPSFDLFIDDKVMESRVFFQLEDIDASSSE